MVDRSARKLLDLMYERDALRFDVGGLVSRQLSKKAGEAMAKKLAEQQTIKASEALAPQVNKVLGATEVDRMLTDPSKGLYGGVNFSALQHLSPQHKKAEAVWGVTKEGAAKRILGAEAKHPRKETVWTTRVGGPESHRGNEIVFGRLVEDFAKKLSRDEVTEQQILNINKRLSSSVDKEGNLIFPQGFDITDPTSLASASTFEKRQLVSSVLGGQGVGGMKGRVTDYDRIIQETMEPILADVKTGMIGPRLFTLSGNIIEEPALNPAFPKILTGRDLGVQFAPAPGELMLPTWHKQFQAVKGRAPTEMDFRRGLYPTEPITDKMLNRLAIEGFDEGGPVGKKQMKKGGAVRVSDNPDTMRLELDRKYDKGGDVKTTGEIKPIPRNPYYGKAADILKYVHENILSRPGGYNNPPGEILGELLSLPAMARVLEDKSYGFPVTNIGKANVPLLTPDTGELAMTALPFAKPVAKGAAQAIKEAPGALRAAEAGIKRPFTPVTVPIEAVSPYLGQRSPESFRRGITERLLGDYPGAVDIGTMAGQPTTRMPGQGVFKSQITNKVETNPMVATYVPGVGDISKNAPFKSAMANVGEALEQEGMAAIRFIPMMTAGLKDASAVLIKPKKGSITNEQIIELTNRLGDKMVVSHNPQLGGVVVVPFGEAKPGVINREFARARKAGQDVLGENFDIKLGAADINKDRMYMQRIGVPEYGIPAYSEFGLKPVSPETARIRDELKYMERQLFPDVGSATPGAAKEAPTGGVQPWSRGRDYPTSVIGVGTGSKTEFQPVNFATEQSGPRFPSYKEADEAREKMLQEWYESLPTKIR